MPERTPLEPKITGVIDRAEGFRLEKLHFQSRPKLYVTGNLYVPKDAKAGAKLPAVLYVCGHSGRGRDGNKSAFQHVGSRYSSMASRIFLSASSRVRPCDQQLFREGQLAT